MDDNGSGVRGFRAIFDFRALTQSLTFNKSFDRTSSCLLLETLSTQEPHWGSQMIGMLQVGGARGL